MGQGGAVLLVDDDLTLVRVVRRCLEHGPRLEVAHSVKEALTALAGVHDLVGSIVDLGLPDGDGHEVLRAVVQKFPGRPALVLTGRTDAASINGSAQLGAVYAVKPVGLQVLEGFVARAVMAGRADGAVMEAALARYAAAHRLTPIQARLLAEAARGVENDDLPAAMGMKKSAVERHIREVIRRTGAPRFSSAVRDALRGGVR